MDANLHVITQRLNAQDAKLQAVAKAIMPLLAMAAGRAEDLKIERHQWDALAYELNSAFDFNLMDS